jgi:hypothetical protein
VRETRKVRRAEASFGEEKAEASFRTPKVNRPSGTRGAIPISRHSAALRAGLSTIAAPRLFWHGRGATERMARSIAASTGTRKVGRVGVSDFNFKDSVRIEALEKLFRSCEIEFFVARLDDQEKAVGRGEREARNVEHWVIRRGHAVEREHAEYGGERGAQNGELKRNRNPGWPTVVRPTADNQGEADHVGVVTHEEAGKAAEDSTDEDETREQRGSEANGFSKAFDRNGRKDVDALEAGIVRAASGGEHLLGRLELGQQPVNGLASHADS